MNSPILVAITAGLISALVVIAAMKGVAILLLLIFLTSVPIFVVALGWGLKNGLISAAVGALAISIFSGAGVSTGIQHFLTMYLPFLAFAFLLHLNRPFLAGGFGRTGQSGDWHPMLEIMIAAAFISALMIIFFILSIGSTMAELETRLEPLYTQALKIIKESGIQQAEQDVLPKRAFFTNLFIFASVGIYLNLLVNFWIGLSVTRKLQRLPKAWPDTSTMNLPDTVLIGYVVVVALAFITSGLPQLMLAILMYVLSVLYALFGLHVVHAATRHMDGRTPLLFMVYLMLAIMLPIVGIVLIIIGVGEPIFKLRQRARNRSSDSGAD